MRLEPMFKADADKHPWTGTILRIIAVLTVIGGFFENMLVTAIIAAVFMFAIAGILDYLHEIACQTRGYFVLYDEADMQPTQKDQNEMQ